MMLPNNLMYTKDHEWINIENNIATVGITEYAQSELGDIIFVEFSDIGSEHQTGDTIGTIEAVKTVADLYTPIAGKIIEVNNILDEDPSIINSDPYSKGWILKLEISNSNIDNLMNADEYKKII